MMEEKKMYTHEERLLYPATIGLITRKNKPDMIIDSNNVESILGALNNNDFVYIEKYNTTIHKSDVENISVVITRDIHIKMIVRMLLKRTEIENKKKL